MVRVVQRVHAFSSAHELLVALYFERAFIRLSTTQKLIDTYRLGLRPYDQVLSSAAVPITALASECLLALRQASAKHSHILIVLTFDRCLSVHRSILQTKSKMLSVLRKARLKDKEMRILML